MSIAAHALAHPWMGGAHRLTPADVALWDAAEAADLSGVKAALAAGASPNCRASQGFTPLLHAAGEKNLALLQALLDAGGDLLLEDGFGVWCLGEALKAGHAEVVTFLLDRPEYSLKEFQGPYFDRYTSVMGYGVLSRRIDLLELLLAKGFDVNGWDPQRDWCALKSALRPDYKEVALWLLAHGALPDGPPGMVLTPLHWACRFRHGQDSVPLLLAAGASVDFPDSRGRTCLLQAVVRGSETLIRMLLEAGADPLRQDSYGRSPRGEAEKRHWDRLLCLFDAYSPSGHLE